ncbi:MAG: glycoside hydrolase family 88 protein [Spirochaetaceae bacterium]|jgi:unsaturated chondroitin disaccharide hydrolase|nr:glycoside hydrolase family 88 protein [Spirochaetaceae bacterium]
MDTDETRRWAQQVWANIEAKISAECGRIGSQVPYIARNGKYEDVMASDPFWWTNGFWAGILWLLHHDTGEEKYSVAARGVEDRLDECLTRFTGLHHDVGFMWLHTAVLDYRLTKQPRSLERALHGAAILAGRFNPWGRYIRAWNGDKTGWMIIDCLMNLALLYWASEQTGDPRFSYIAMDHADTALKCLVRDDGSCNHIGIMDLKSPKLLEAPAGQGYASGSSWTRGQAWGLYGFAISADHAKNCAEEKYREYLAASKRIAHYFISSAGSYGYIPPIDFRAPKEPDLRDSSAGAIAACGLLRLAGLLPKEEQAFYRDSAFRFLKAIEENCCDWDPARDAIVQKGSCAYHTASDEHHVPLIYADYFFIEAVHQLRHPDFRVW